MFLMTAASTFMGLPCIDSGLQVISQAIVFKNNSILHTFSHRQLVSAYQNKRNQSQIVISKQITINQLCMIEFIVLKDCPADEGMKWLAKSDWNVMSV